MTDLQAVPIRKKVSLILSQCRSEDPIYAIIGIPVQGAVWTDLRIEPVVQTFEELKYVVLKNEQVQLLSLDYSRNL